MNLAPFAYPETRSTWMLATQRTAAAVLEAWNQQARIMLRGADYIDGVVNGAVLTVARCPACEQPVVLDGVTLPDWSGPTTWKCRGCGVTCHTRDLISIVPHASGCTCGDCGQ